MIRRPPRSTRTDTLFPYPTLFRSWPFRAEIDVRPLARTLIAAGTRVGLPVVVTPNAPVEFREWTPGAAMTKGVWNIPVRSEERRVGKEWVSTGRSRWSTYH